MSEHQFLFQAPVQRYKRSAALFVLSLSLLFTGSLCAAEQAKSIRSGDILPTLRLQLVKGSSDQHYLGLDPQQTEFTPQQIRAELILIEFINVHCPHCREQAPSYNKLYEKIAQQPEYQPDIKMLAIAVGNLPEEVEAFRRQFDVPFPVIADSNFVAWRAIDGKATPFTILVRQNGEGQPGTVAATHSGTNHNIRGVFSQLTELLKLRPEQITHTTLAPRQDHETTETYSAEDLDDEVYHAFRNIGRVSGFSKLQSPPGHQLYSALVYTNKRGQRLFAEVIQRQSVCDVCHDVHFIYLFDPDGKIVDIVALQLTKYGNRNWDQTDIDQLKKRLVGQTLQEMKSFSPQVDAITSATITSAIIYNSLQQRRNLMDKIPRH